LAVVAVLIVYPYVVYPGFLALVSRIKTRHEQETQAADSSYSATVDFVICVYNGEAHIEKKLRNVVGLRGFRPEYRVLVLSDCSTDRTDEIVNAFPHPSVRLIRMPSRVGKTSAENHGLRHTAAEILVFTDASTLFEDEALMRIIERFSDPKVGCVSTEDIVVSEKDGVSPMQEGAYVKYEMFVRRLESRLGILAGASGSGYACRRQLAIEIPVHLTRDLFVPLHGHELGFRTVTEPRAKCQIVAQQNAQKELGRKIRTFTGGIDTLLCLKHLMNPMKHGWFAMSVLSHKLVRWLGPLFLVVLLALSVVASFWGPWMWWLVTLQLGTYAYCGFRFYRGRPGPIGMMEIVYFFLVTNVAAGIAWINHFKRKTFVTWEPTSR
jgi:cellulose synthase/poly-beta-1,6-N-acetylglucosamine synthase-like glycosyltransferase